MTSGGSWGVGGSSLGGGVEIREAFGGGWLSTTAVDGSRRVALGDAPFAGMDAVTSATSEPTEAAVKRRFMSSGLRGVSLRLL